MGRAKKNTVDYFPHFCKNGKTIFILKSRFGNDGYAVWFQTLELLGSSDNHFFDCRNAVDWEYLSAEMGVLPDRLQQIYDLCAHLNAIDKELWENRVIRSQNFIDHLENVYLRRTNKCISKRDLCKHLSIKCKHNADINSVSDNKSTQSKVKESKVKESKKNIPKIAKHKYGDYKHVLLSDDDLQNLKDKFSDYKQRITNLDEYIETSGKSYKNHYLVIVRWSKNDKQTSSKRRDHKVSSEKYKDA